MMIIFTLMFLLFPQNLSFPIIFGFVVFLGLMKNWKKIMMLLLCLELFSIVFIFILIFFLPESSSFPFLFTFFTLAVSEASVGLALLLNYFRMWESALLKFP